MKLVWYKSARANFGDDLNPWIWPKILPGLLDNNDEIIFIGLGTLLETWFLKDLPLHSRKVVLGAGGGMEFPAPHLGEDYDVYGVRGFLTAQYHHLPPSLALTDPAMCLRTLWTLPKVERSGVGFMPHYTSSSIWNWDATCRDAGLVYVDPSAPYEATLNLIGSLKGIITEAMHGAIVADAFRVPWLPARISPGNYMGKWDDWASTVRVPVQFSSIPELYDPVIAHQAEHPIKRQLSIWRGWVRSKSSRKEHELALRQLANLKDSVGYRLSDDASLDEALSRFHGQVSKLVADYG